MRSILNHRPNSEQLGVSSSYVRVLAIILAAAVGLAAWAAATAMAAVPVKAVLPTMAAGFGGDLLRGNNPANELRKAIDELESLHIDVAKLNNVAVKAYRLLQERIDLPSLDNLPTLRVEGYDVTNLRAFLSDLESAPTPAKRESAAALVFALNLIRDIRASVYPLSDASAATGYQAGLSAFSFSMRANRVTELIPGSYEMKSQISRCAGRITRSTVRLLSRYLPEEAARYVPICLWIGSTICECALGLPVSVQNGGVRLMMVKTISRLAFMRLDRFGFIPRTQHLLDELAAAAQSGRLYWVDSELRGRMSSSFSTLQAQIERICEISLQERMASYLIRSLGDLSTLLMPFDPTRVSGVAAGAAGLLSAGATAHSLFGPLQKFAVLPGDLDNLLAPLYGWAGQPVSSDVPALSDEAEEAIAAKEARLKSLLERYAEACQEFESLYLSTGNQREFFLKIKELEQLDYEIAVLTYSR